MNGSTSSGGIVVFGYSDVGYECLDLLIARGENVRCVFTHADAPGERVWFRSVAELARRHGIPVILAEPQDGPEVAETVKRLAPDLILSFYYRRMIPMAALDRARRGAFNMHGSLLPKYRGRAPVNWAVLHGERETGVTLHRMAKRADAGAIVDREAVAIGPEETAFEVMQKLVPAARRVLERQIDALKRGAAPRIVQDESQASYFGGRRPEDGRIDWRQPAQRIVDLVRAVAEPFPGAFTHLDGRRLYVWRAHAGAGAGRPGEVVSSTPLRVAAGEGTVEIGHWQWDGGPIVESPAGGEAPAAGRILD
ncbi:MAG: formyltransferase [Rhodospirillales bacterium]|nr:formyltransferase [Rhodospirillales bacterium]